ncbi:MAG: DUF3300 domain-containing protein [Deltaproteobacteria bacterium]|nr:DUF3300 domain-containing protein [Deltaproteobacteria bacterium]
MKRKRSFISIFIWLLVLFMAAVPWGFAQDQGTQKKFKQEELDQMLAPIALYSDDLLTQVLMASTYPLEIAQADRWAKENKALKGDQLTAALEKQGWDPSVKSLVNCPEVLTMMNEKLDWTIKLGDAFLTSKKDVMDTIQKLRLKAKEAGILKSNDQQKVLVQETVIVIEPTNPTYVYVATYDPMLVYGTWWWTGYYPYSYYPYYGYGGGFWLGAAWGYAWGHADWHGGDVNIDIDRNAHINPNINRDKYKNEMRNKGQVSDRGKGTWQHDASHRKGVSYRDQATTQKYNRGASTQDVKSRDAYRGRTDQGGQSLEQRRDTDRGRGEAGGQRRDDAFSGMGDGNKTRDYSSRGNSSRDRMSSSGGGSGGRGGGGWGGGGGRGGGRGGRR